MTSNGTQGIRKQASELIERAYQRGYKVGREGGYKDWKNYVAIDNKSFIEQGRNEAWEAARKLVSMGYKECNEVLSDGILTIETDDDIFIRLTASEAIEKIRVYEEQKRQEEDSKIHVGDEVTDDYGVIGVVVGSFRKSDGTEEISVLSTSYKVPQLVPIEYYKKTGRTFPEIAEVLKKMQEDKE